MYHFDVYFFGVTGRYMYISTYTHLHSTGLGEFEKCVKKCVNNGVFVGIGLERQL